MRLLLVVWHLISEVDASTLDIGLDFVNVSWAEGWANSCQLVRVYPEPVVIMGGRKKRGKGRGKRGGRGKGRGKGGGRAKGGERGGFDYQFGADLHKPDDENKSLRKQT